MRTSNQWSYRSYWHRMTLMKVQIGYFSKKKSAPKDVYWASERDRFNTRSIHDHETRQDFQLLNVRNTQKQLKKMSLMSAINSSSNNSCKAMVFLLLFGQRNRVSGSILGSLVFRNRYASHTPTIWKAHNRSHRCLRSFMENKVLHLPQ